jgi:hypothetical protein
MPELNRKNATKTDTRTFFMLPPFLEEWGHLYSPSLHKSIIRLIPSIPQTPNLQSKKVIMQPNALQVVCHELPPLLKNGVISKKTLSPIIVHFKIIKQ